ncbi:hypothetical protein [Magnetovibrio sp.]|uniref:hypothetical protein n=1 Tax=Magnetovibrio sp. TaxID=2024836 RepID=UPI002F935D98
MKLLQRPMHTLFSAALVALVGLGLGACTGDKPTPPPCPDILIVADGAKLTRFKPGPGRDIIDVLHEEEIAGFAHSCEYDTDETGAGELTVWLSPAIVSKRGPANQTGDADFEYIIATTDAQKNILYKGRYPLVLTYTENVPNLMWQRPEPHELVLPLKPGQTGEDYLIYLSLALNRVELEYQRKNR